MDKIKSLVKLVKYTIQRLNEMSQKAETWGKSSSPRGFWTVDQHKYIDVDGQTNVERCNVGENTPTLRQISRMAFELGLLFYHNQVFNEMLHKIVIIQSYYRIANLTFWHYLMNSIDSCNQIIILCYFYQQRQSLRIAQQKSEMILVFFFAHHVVRHNESGVNKLII